MLLGDLLGDAHSYDVDGAYNRKRREETRYGTKSDDE
jgi:hypothetical protein